MFTVVIISNFKKTPTVYQCGNRGFADQMAQVVYGEVSYIYDQFGAFVTNGVLMNGLETIQIEAVA